LRSWGISNRRISTIFTSPSTTTDPDLFFKPVVGHAEAQKAIKRAGTNAIPLLLKCIRDEERFRGAVFAFRLLGPVAAPAIPDLAVIIRDRQGNRDDAPGALMGVYALAGIAAHDLGSADKDRRLGAALLLRAAGQEARGQKQEPLVGRAERLRLFEDATNALLRLAPELLGKAP